MSNVDVDKRMVVRRLSTVEPEAVEWLWPGRLARRKLTILVGDPGVGKSTVALSLAATLSQGTPWPDGTQASIGRTLIIASEDGVADTIVPRLETHHADRAQIFEAAQVSDGDVERLFDLSTDIDPLRKTIKDERIDLVIIDPLTAYLGPVDSHRDADVRRTLTPLVTLMAETNVALVAIAHLTKNDTVKALYRPGGSIAFMAMARIGLCVAAEANDPERRILSSLKNNLTLAPPSLAFRLQDGAVEWESDPVDVSADEMLSSELHQRGARSTPAAHFLTELMADEQAWPRAATSVSGLAADRGIAARSLQRAAKKLGIRISREGFGKDGTSVWDLPPRKGGGSHNAKTVTSMTSMTHKNDSHIDVIGVIDDIKTSLGGTPCSS
jgi:putative DNA primase/helicase